MWQFSTRTLFLLTAIAAGVVWVYFAPPQWAGLIVLYFIYFLLPAAVLAGIVYHRGPWQAFFIGCAPWAAAITFFMWVWIIDEMPRLDLDDLLPRSSADSAEVMLFKFYISIPLAVTAASGLAAMLVRVWAVRDQRRQSPPV